MTEERPMTKPTRTRAEAVHDALLEAKSDVDHAFAEAIKRHEPPRYVPPEQHAAFEAGRATHIDGASPGGQPDLSPGDNAIHTAIKNGRYFLDRMDDEVSLDLANRGALRACFDALVAEVDRIHPLLALAEVDRQDLAFLRKRIAELEAQANTDAAEIRDLKGALTKADRAYGIAIERLNDSRAALPEYIQATDRLFRYFSEITGYQIRQSDPIGTRVHTLTRFVHEIEDSRRIYKRAADTAKEDARRRGVTILELTETAGAHLCRAEKAEARAQEQSVLIVSLTEDIQKATEAMKAISLPVLPLDFVEMLTGRFVMIVDEPSDKRGAIAKRLAQDVETFLRHMGAEAKPSEPMTVALRSSMHVEVVRQFAKDLAEAAASNASVAPQLCFGPIYLGLEDAISAGRMTVKIPTRSRNDA